jgi:hypothetical protein
MLKRPEKKMRKMLKRPEKKRQKAKKKRKKEMPRRSASRRRAEAHGEKPFVAVRIGSVIASTIWL